MSVEMCAHESTEIRRKMDSLGRPFFKRQCLNCGQAVGDAVAQRNIPNVESVKDWNAVLESEGSQTAAVERAVSRDDRRVQWWTWYSDYLQTDVWRNKRMRVLERDDYLCQACRRERATEVHHLSYRHVGDEPLFELTSVCKRCHDKLTAQDRELTGAAPRNAGEAA